MPEASNAVMLAIGLTKDQIRVKAGLECYVAECNISIAFLFVLLSYPNINELYVAGIDSCSIPA